MTACVSLRLRFFAPILAAMSRAARQVQPVSPFPHHEEKFSLFEHRKEGRKRTEGRKGKERKGKERKGKERTGKERKGKERKGKEKKVKDRKRKGKGREG